MATVTVSDFELFSALLGICYVIAGFNIIRILKQDISEGAAFGWIMLNLSFPLVGVPLFMLLGQNKITGYIRRRRRARKKAQSLGTNISNNPINNSAVSPSALHPIDFLDPHSSGFRFQAIFAPMDATCQVMPSTCSLLINGDEVYPKIFAAIAAAKQFILIQYYILRGDRLGLELKELLKQKSRAGVQVFLQIDDWGSMGLGRRYVTDLRAAGIRVTRFLPFKLRFSFQMNFRNHRKLVLIDGLIAFTGGLNVGVEYLGNGKETFWRDTHVMLEGSAILPLMEAFWEDWYFATKDDLRTHIAPLNLNPKPSKSLPVQIISFGPDDDTNLGLTLFSQAIQMAKSEILIATPYFVPDEIIAWDLNMAAKRGVKIKLLIPQESDSYFVHVVSLVKAQKVASFVEVYLYNKGFMHQKVMLIDRCMAILGTANIDNRSLYLNFETSVVIHDATFGEGVFTMLQNDLLEATRIRKPQKAIAPLLRPFSGLFRLLSPLF